ncbi:MAG: hypothetical protein IJ292_03385 [Clostridia bacterium]|nr:hypothetical protein [Clostridia bacterium]
MIKDEDNEKRIENVNCICGREMRLKVTRVDEKSRFVNVFVIDNTAFVWYTYSVIFIKSI